VPHWDWLDEQGGGGGGASSPSVVNAPHGGTLVDLMVDLATRRSLENDIAEGRISAELTLTARQSCDIELLLTGGFSPLTGFLNRADYDRVVKEKRLVSGVLWPMPITLDLTAAKAAALGGRGARVALRDEFHNLIAVLTVGDVWQPDKTLEATQV
jgi:sulfate adenylyltransferase